MITPNSCAVLHGKDERYFDRDIALRSLGLSYDDDKKTVTVSKIRFHKRLDVLNALVRMTGGFKDNLTVGASGLDELFAIVAASGKSRPQDNIVED